jgi:hypothetical protein
VTESQTKSDFRGQDMHSGSAGIPMRYFRVTPAYEFSRQILHSGVAGGPLPFGPLSLEIAENYRFRVTARFTAS